jgi:hypothetical protein
VQVDIYAKNTDRYAEVASGQSDDCTAQTRVGKMLDPVDETFFEFVDTYVCVRVCACTPPEPWETPGEPDGPIDLLPCIVSAPVRDDMLSCRPVKGVVVVYRVFVSHPSFLPLSLLHLSTAPPPSRHPYLSPASKGMRSLALIVRSHSFPCVDASTMGRCHSCSESSRPWAASSSLCASLQHP